MFDFDNIKRYKQYLNTIQEFLDKYFESQKEYICCKKGCAFCCQKGRYPYSKLEFEYLSIGLMALDEAEKQKVFERIEKLKSQYNGDMYSCPFLSEDNSCVVYEYRGLICRTFGLLKFNEKGELILPFCHKKGLNYSKVFNPEKNILDMDLVNKFEYKNVPKAYNVSLSALMDKNLFEGEPIEFGEIKSLHEWL